MVIILVNEIVAVDLRVHGRDVSQRLDAGLHKEAHEAELHAVPLLEIVFVFFAQLNDMAHVHVVERGQHCGCVLCVF